MEPIKNLKLVTLENIPALLEWIKKYNLSIDQVRQVYFMSSEIEEELIHQLVVNKIWKAGLI